MGGRRSNILYLVYVHFVTYMTFLVVHRGASSMRTGQGIWILRQGILGQFKPFVRHFRGKWPVQRHFSFSGQGMYPPPTIRCPPGTWLQRSYTCVWYCNTYAIVCFYPLRLLPPSRVFSMPFLFTRWRKLTYHISSNRRPVLYHEIPNIKAPQNISHSKYKPPRI